MSTIFLPLLTVLIYGSFVAGEIDWSINILEDPAPPPDEGPPLSAGANRDPAHLKFEVATIAGAYAVWIILTLFLIFFVGRPLRKRALFSNEPPMMEMFKPKPKVLVREVAADREKSTVTSPKMSSFKSWGKGHKSNPSDTTISTIDNRVVEHDRARNMDEMAKLYAAVMEEDEHRSHRPQKSTSSGSTFAEAQHPPVTPRSPLGPPEFQHLRQPLSHPMAPTPTDAHFPQPMSPQYPQYPQYAQNPQYTQNPQYAPNPQYAQYGEEDRYGPTPASFVSTGTTRVGSADTYKSRQSRGSVRGQAISRPLGNADLRESVAVGLPSSPRMYAPGPPPPTPGRSRPTTREGERRAPPANLALDGAYQTNAGQAGSSNSLPFRQFYSESLRSAPATKTTFVESKPKSTAPRSAVPHTPYSPYTPFTPMTPITPGHLPSKSEMRKHKKKNALKALREEELVQSDSDMWGA